MHPTFLGAVLTLHCALHALLAATVTSESMSPGGTDPEAENNVLSPKWESDTDLLASYLEQLLREHELWDSNELPLLYVEDANSEGSEEDDALSVPWKRSRYYRRYPWKRQNGRHRSQYADASRYMCNPTREDVFQLLVALHEAREGNTRRTVNFCNRKRPASTIFTNIRFLGRRK
ncbi:uncharacterized protein LOC111861761 [Cryptotermes secundus]|uniref:uncharacterized protein LOC111861761 n=1 Tax=Cryptotermes secundus TaxID=105785 RepID=UPI000CD7CED8|nr:uncharacterized protein LOC111861761 [Cryptotermes secundus]